MPCSTVNGPGQRAVVWTQGCTLRCAGCWNPQTHDFNDLAGVQISPYNLAVKIASIEGIEGLTLSGGEPMYQAPELFCVICYLKGRRPDLSIGMFTGYTRKELDEGHFQVRPDTFSLEDRVFIWERLKERLDFAIMGRYDKQQPVFDKPLRSSANQELVLFSQRYSESDFIPPEVEMVVYDDTAKTQVTGFPFKGALK